MRRFVAYLVIGIVYVLAFTAGWFTFLFAAPDGAGTMGIVLGLALADVVATLVVWAFGLIFKNSSFYDPYWSITPWFIILAVMLRFSLYSPANILFLIAFSIWSWRLTVNWAYTCTDLKCQDWRYVMFKKENPPVLWHIINLMGINMMPTVLVFLATIPGILLVLANVAFTPLMLGGTAVILFGTLLEVLADNSMHTFRKNPENKGKVVDTGLWKYSRHPNYLGEIIVWVGVYLFMLAAVPANWFMGFGMVLIAALFMFISIPMMEKRQTARRPEYIAYQKRTSMLLLLPQKPVAEVGATDEDEAEAV